MPQLEFFARSQLASWRDRTASRNYSAERDQFRRDHARHRDWGLRQRHGRRSMYLRIYGDVAPPSDRDTSCPAYEPSAPLPEPAAADQCPAEPSSGNVSHGREPACADRPGDEAGPADPNAPAATTPPADRAVSADGADPAGDAVPAPARPSADQAVSVDVAGPANEAVPAAVGPSAGRAVSVDAASPANHAAPTATSPSADQAAPTDVAGRNERPGRIRPAIAAQRAGPTRLPGPGRWAGPSRRPGAGQPNAGSGPRLPWASRADSVGRPGRASRGGQQPAGGKNLELRASPVRAEGVVGRATVGYRPGFPGRAGAGRGGRCPAARPARARPEMSDPPGSIRMPAPVAAGGLAVRPE